MAPFIFLFIYLGVIATWTSKMSVKIRSKYQAILGGLGLWILLALRSWTCGQDLYYDIRGVGYIVSFTKMIDVSFSDLFLGFNNGYEIGFNLLNWFIYHYISSNPQVFLAIISLINIFLVGYTFYKQSPNILLSYLAFSCLGLYIFGFSGLRQSLSVSLTFFAFNFIHQKKPFLFLLIVFLAFTIHKSSIIFLPALVFRNKILSFNLAIIATVGIFIMLPFLMSIIQFFSVLIYGYEKGNSEEGGAFGLFFLYLFLLFYSFSSNPKDEDGFKKFNLCRWMALCALFLQSSGILSAGALARIAYPFSIFFALLLPMTLEFKSKSLRIVTKAIVIICLIAFFIYSNKDGYLNVVPYRFFWEEIYLL